jgi:signal peptidase II
MQKSKLPQAKWNIILICLACLVIGLDQLSKVWIRSHMLLGQSIPETGFFRLTYAQNTGAAFSIFYGRVEILGIISIIGTIILLLYIFYFSRHMPFQESPWTKIALGLMLGGTDGNMIDRLFLGGVTDFLDVGPWPIFNIADSSLVVGVTIFAIWLISVGRKADSEQKT